MSRWISTAAVAKQLGVGTTSVKRWAEQGLLLCRHTPGGHRRFDVDQVTEFMRSHSALKSTVSNNVETWLEIFSGPTSQHAAYDAILQARSRLPSWCALADELGEVLVAVGQMWRAGNMSITTEHELSELLGRALAQCASTIPGNPDKRCILATAPGDPHTLGLSLLEVCIREMGYGTRWLGARTPVEELTKACADPTTCMIALSASGESRDVGLLDRYLESLKADATENEVVVLLGGHGRWPADPPVGLRLMTFSELPTTLRRVMSIVRS